MDEDEIGLYVNFDPNDIKKYFSERMFGDYYKEEFVETKKFSLLYVEEGA